MRASQFIDIIPLISSLIQAFVLITVAIIGRNTFRKWREQKISERKIDQAERILTAAYKVRRGLSDVRSPLISAYELDVSEKKLIETDKISADKSDDYRRKKIIILQCYYNRINLVRPDFKLLDECQPFARALFGEDLEKAIETLNHQLHIVRVSAEMMVDLAESDDLNYKKEIERALNLGYRGGVSNEIDDATSKNMDLIESICLPVLRI